MQASGCSFVITDPKGELFNTYGRYLEKMGYEVKILNIDDMSHSCCYNPFNYIRNDDDVTDMCQVFMENTNGDNGVQKGDFWDKMSMIQLEALCFLIRATYPKEKHNWYEVANLLRQAIPEKDEDGMPIPTEVDKLMEDLNRKEESHIAYLKWLDFKSIAKNDETVANAVGSTIARITRFSNRNIKNLTSYDTVHLEDIGKKKTALFCLTKAANSTYNFIMGMCYMQLFQTLEAVARDNGGKLPVYTRFLLDEFANICKIPKFDEWLAYIRSFGVSIAIIIQTYKQLDKIYDKAAGIITGNCDFTLFLGTSDEEVAKKISERLGKATIYRKELVKGNQYKRVPMQRDLMTTGEVLAMKNDECILFCAGKNPIFDKKIKTWLLPNFKYTHDSTKAAEDWYATNDFKAVDDVYKELKGKVIEQPKIEEVIEKPISTQEVVKEEPKQTTTKAPEVDVTTLESIIASRDKNIDEARIDSLNSTKNLISESEVSQYVSENFSNKQEMEESVYVIDSFDPGFEMNTSYDISSLIQEYLNKDKAPKEESQEETSLEDNSSNEEIYEEVNYDDYSSDPLGDFTSSDFPMEEVDVGIDDFTPDIFTDEIDVDIPLDDDFSSF